MKTDPLLRAAHQSSQSLREMHLLDYVASCFYERNPDTNDDLVCECSPPLQTPDTPLVYVMVEETRCSRCWRDKP